MTLKISDLDYAEMIDAKNVNGATGWYTSFYSRFFKPFQSATASATATSTVTSDSPWPTLVIAETFAVTNTSAAGSYSRSSSAALILPQE